jgi:heterodisulfide reductase subunit C
MRPRGAPPLDSQGAESIIPTPILLTSQPDLVLIQRIEALSGQRTSDCYQCGSCTAGCPVGEMMDPPPSRGIRLLQLGRAQELVESTGIWLCASCVVCATRCPRGVDYGRVAEACRAIRLRAKDSRVDPDTIEIDTTEDIPQQAFVAGFRKFSG